MKSCRCWTALVGKQRAVVGAGVIREQVVSERSELATCRGYVLFLLYCLLLYCSLLQCKSFMSGYLSTWVGLFSRERVLKNTPTPCLEQPLKFITHGRIFKRLWYFWTQGTKLSDICVDQSSSLLWPCDQLQNHDCYVHISTCMCLCFMHLCPSIAEGVAPL